MSEGKNQRYVLGLLDGLRFEAGPETWALQPLGVEPRTWVAFVPGGEEPVADPAAALARILSTLREPLRGRVELWGNDVYQLEYLDLQRLRSRIGFVHGQGGLLSNLTVRENVALSLSARAARGPTEEQIVIGEVLEEFALDRIADLHPHEVDGSTRWRACLARAVVGQPQWVVLEGLGNWEMDQGSSTGWRRLGERQRAGRITTAICLPRQNRGFEAWFEKQQGTVIRYLRSRPSIPGRLAQ